MWLTLTEVEGLRAKQAALVLVEAALGENLVWLTDHLDQLVRQKDPETLRRLKQLNDAWVVSARAVGGGLSYDPK